MTRAARAASDFQRALPSRLIVASVDDEEASSWDAFVGSAVGASIYHRYQWRKVVQDAFGRETHYVAARVDGRISGVLPLVRLTSRLFGDFLVSLPYFNYGGILSQSDATTDLLLHHGRELAVRLGVSHMELRHRAKTLGSLPARTDKITMLRRLPAAPEALWRELSSKVRAQIRRPEKEGAECVHGGQELLGEFFDVFAENMRDLGTPVYPRHFFERIVAGFPVETRTFVVRLAGKAVAAALVIGDGRTLEIPWASSLRRANPLGVNMLLYWRALEFACQHGYEIFDFGRCTENSGPHRFKKQWGAEPQQLYWHYWMRDGGELPRLNHSNPKFDLAIAAWRKLPLFIANRLGPMLVKNLP